MTVGSLVQIFWQSTVVLCAIMGGIGQVLFKKGAESLQFVPLKLNLAVLTGLFLYGVSLLLYLKSLKYLPLTSAYPLIAISYMVVMIISRTTEQVTLINIAGSLLLILAVGMMVR